MDLPREVLEAALNAIFPDVDEGESAFSIRCKLFVDTFKGNNFTPRIALSLAAFLTMTIEQQALDIAKHEIFGHSSFAREGESETSAFVRVASELLKPKTERSSPYRDYIVDSGSEADRDSESSTDIDANDDENGSNVRIVPAEVTRPALAAAPPPIGPEVLLPDDANIMPLVIGSIQ